MSARNVRIVFCVVAAAALAGCGGGGGSGADTQSSSSAVSDEVQSNTTNKAHPTTIMVDGCAVEEYQAAMLEYVNAARSKARSCGSEDFPPAPPVQYSCAIQGAATEHSQDMATNNFFSHTGSDGLRVGDRVTATGYDWSVVGENIAAGYDQVDGVMKAWLESPGHCRNIMDARFQEFAVKRVDTTTADYPNYWTQVFADPR
ncbi:CAP domain-containing protein [Marinobacter koreensis]|uniref:CAP domain-containing protein n=1 Tax=Marinobacter koreensis TaxID=335974 RepID=A0ABW0RMI6_9GAMM|nr:MULTISPECIES: CAP domain-containing protein [Marinobacter]MCK7549441.1 CAP domain-containing protein [Marinobacter koreensis]